jgi:hypothetical protein
MERCGRKRSWPKCKVLSRYLPGGTEKKHENLSEDRRFPSQDLNAGPPEYEARRSVFHSILPSSL